MAQQNNAINCRLLPTELLNELYGSLPLENAFHLLTKMPNCFLARNVQKMINCIKMAIKENKWNKEDCGSFFEISEDGLIVENTGSFKCSTVRAILSIPTLNLDVKNSYIASYFEVQIPNNWSCIIRIGYCTKQFPLEGKLLGNLENSFRIDGTGYMKIEGKEIKFENCVRNLQNDGDVIGIGIIHHPNSKMECFGTWNGQLFGKVELPPKYANLQLYPAINFCCANSIETNFGKKEWRFNKINEILQ